MKQAAYILMIISTVMSGFAILPLAWMIPMTIATKNRMLNNPSESAVALGVCAILFAWPFGLIAGILLLIPDN